MASVTEQKSNLREIIHNALRKRMDEHSEETVEIAMGLATRLSARMTLEELRDWHRALLVIPGLMREREET